MRNEQKSTLLVSHQTLRRFIGFLGLLLPVGLILNHWLTTKEFQPTLGMYYHTELRDIFVVGFAAIGLFLLSYSGYGRQKGQLLTDGFVARLAGVAALGMVFLPIPIGEFNFSSCMSGFPATLQGCAHFGFSGTFFLVMAIFGLILFRRTDDKMTKRKSKRNKLFFRSGTIIVLTMGLVAAFYAMPTSITAPFAKYNPLLWLQGLAMGSFGLAWLTKGGGLFWMNDSKHAQAKPARVAPSPESGKEDEAATRKKRNQARSAAREKAAKEQAEKEKVARTQTDVSAIEIPPPEDKAAETARWDS